jgi:AraC family transcriptional regulator, arabinose operon regulatory protein
VPGPLMTGDTDYRGDIYGYRPRGTQDWIFTLTLAGRARFEAGGKWHAAGPGDVVLIKPGFPQDYGVDLTVGRWKSLWAHFVPRPEVLAWVQWPEVLPGHYALRLEGALRAEVGQVLRRMHEWRMGAHLHGEELAMRLLEQALLLCDGANFWHPAGRRDERIQRILEFICAHLEEPLAVRILAKKAGLSRSRFVALFHEEAGLPPQAWIEQRRLTRARDLLDYAGFTSSQIAERVGFASPFYFSLRFKKHFGLSPRHYRDRARPRLKR